MSEEKKDVVPKKAAGETKGTGKRAASSEKLTEKIGKHRKECLQDGIWKVARDMYVCIYIGIYVYMRIHMYICIHVHMYVYMFI